MATAPVASVKLEWEDKGFPLAFRALMDDMLTGPSMVDIGIHPTDPELVVIASANEFGAWAGKGHKTFIPSRSFIRSTIDEMREKYGAEGQRMLGEVLDGKMDLQQALALMGTRVQRDIQRKINSNIPPPNAKATIDRKGSSHTLVDTGLMLQSIRYAVKRADETIVELGPGGGRTAVGQRVAKTVAAKKAKIQGKQIKAAHAVVKAFVKSGGKSHNATKPKPKK